MKGKVSNHAFGGQLAVALILALISIALIYGINLNRLSFYTEIREDSADNAVMEAERAFLLFCH